MVFMTSKQALRDSSGRSLSDYPRPSVAVDTSVLTVLRGDTTQPPRLAVLLVRRPVTDTSSRAGWALPGTFLHEGETLAGAVGRSLEQKAGVTGRAPQQLHVFDDPGRDDRGWVLSVAHLDVLPIDALDSLRDSSATRVVPVAKKVRLPYDHGAIIDLAVTHLRSEYATTPDPRHLLPAQFTIADLRVVHEAVAGTELQKDTFRRSMIDGLVELPDSASGRLGRPARLFARRSPA
jgi:ADP-ribose pyrophosphatase YjhB (NUDIX family)